MVIRLRIYHSEMADHEEADKIFYTHVKPVHEKHGAIFKGRYRDANGKVVVLWEYENERNLKRVQKMVSNDVESMKYKNLRQEKGLHGISFDEYILKSTDQKF